MRDNRNKLKTLLLATGLEGGGLENYTRNLIHALRPLMKNKRLFTGSLIPPKSKDTKVDFSGLGLHLTTRGIFIFQSLSFILFHKISQVVCNHIAMTIPPLITRKLLGIRYIVFAHGIEVWGRIKKPYLWGLRNADRIICVSRFTRDILIKKHSIPPSKLKILHPCVDTVKFKPGNKNPQLVKKYNLKGKKVILSVGRLSAQEQYKGHDTVILSLKEIIKDVPEAVYLIVGDGDDRKRLESMAEELGLKQHVIFAGFVPENLLVDYYNLCDVFVMPSKFGVRHGRYMGEGFGIVYIEAQSCGKPVIAGKYGGSSDAVLHGETGYLVHPENSNEIAERIIKILKNRRLSERMGRKAREWVIANFSCKIFKDRIKDTLKDFID